MPLERCAWPSTDPLMIEYHDREWGAPVHADRTLFEFLVLESAQAGLSWRTILHRRDGYRKAFAGFDPVAVARFEEAEISRCLADPGIIRNRLKVRATVGNAQAFLKIQTEFGSFDRYIWGFTEGKPIVNHWTELGQIPARTPLSDALSKDMIKRGFKFMGSTIVYAHMQATGMVIDHTVNCFRHKELAGMA
ncbi:DNA-3-methyladenine glycosylase I [bacterium]|nr:DNA-3-methyladenine glycosylase I [bacterium]